MNDLNEKLITDKTYFLNKRNKTVKEKINNVDGKIHKTNVAI